MCVCVCVYNKNGKRESIEIQGSNIYLHISMQQDQLCSYITRFYTRNYKEKEGQIKEKECVYKCWQDAYTHPHTHTHIYKQKHRASFSHRYKCNCRPHITPPPTSLQPNTIPTRNKQNTKGAWVGLYPRRIYKSYAVHDNCVFIYESTWCFRIVQRINN